MPLVFEKEGFRFAFYSNDHKPIHVHVRKAGAEAILMWMKKSSCVNPKVLKSKISIKPSVLPKRIET